jgi:amino acid permease
MTCVMMILALRSFVDDVMTKEYFEEIKHQSTALQVCYNFVNVVVGAGIVGLPYCFLQGGFYGTIFLMIFVCYLTDYSVRMLVKAGIESEVDSYEDLCDALFGAKGWYTVLITMWIYDFGAMLTCKYPTRLMITVTVTVAVA